MSHRSPSFPVVPHCSVPRPGQNRDNSGEDRDNSIPIPPDHHRRRFWFSLPHLRGRRGKRTKAEILAAQKELLENLDRDIDKLVAEMHGRLGRGEAETIGCAYARYSTDYQHSIVDQLRGIFERSIALGVFIPREFVFCDVAVTGRKTQRPGLKLAKAVMEKKTAKVLMVFTTNRLFRTNYACMKYVTEDIVGRKLRCIFVQSGIDTDDTEQWELLLDIRSLLDKLMTTQYAPNIRQAHCSLFLLRMVVSTLPFGYMGEDLPGGAPTKRGLPRQTIVIDHDLAKWVKQIFHWFVIDRLPQARILERLNDQAVPPGPKSDGSFWTEQALHYLLTNECYRGLWSYGKAQNVWQSKAEYDKRVLRDKPLIQKHFEELRLISDEQWYEAQRLLSLSPQLHAGRKPKDGNTATRPRILNGLLKCPTHQSPLKVGGADGHWMFCPKCRGLPKEKRPLYTPVKRDLALRMICRAIADAIRGDEGLVRDLVQPSLVAAERLQKSDGSAKTLAALRIQSDKHTRSIDFTQNNPGDTDRDVEESKQKLKVLRTQRAAADAEIARLAKAEERELRVPTQVEVRSWLDRLDETLEAAAGAYPADAGALRTILELLTGGEVRMVQMGERKARFGWLQARFTLRIAETCSRQLDFAHASDRPQPEIVVDIRETPREKIAESLVEQVMVLYDRDVLVTAIAEQLGVDRHQVSEAVRIGCRLRGLPAPLDGRVRRGRVADKSLKPPVSQNIADAAKRLLDEDLLVEQIAERLKCHRDTVRAALRYWYDSHDLPMPDMRNRRKTLAIKNRPK